MLLIQQLINGLMLGGILAFVAVAFTLTIGMLNFLNFTIPALFMVAAMLGWALLTPGAHPLALGLHWLPALALGVVAAVLASLLIERFTYRYMKTRYGDATEHALPLVSSLGFLIVFEHLAMTLWAATRSDSSCLSAIPISRSPGLSSGCRSSLHWSLPLPWSRRCRRSSRGPESGGRFARSPKIRMLQR